MSVSNMSSSAWTTNLSTGSEPNVSYAERLRQARSQSAGSKTRSSTSAQPQTTKRADPKLATSSPPQSSTGMSSKNNMRSIKSPNSKARMSQIPRRPWTRTLLTPRYHLSHQVKMYGNSVCADEAIEIPTGHQICLKHHIKIASKLARLKLLFINPRQSNQR